MKAETGVELAKVIPGGTSSPRRSSKSSVGREFTVDKQVRGLSSATLCSSCPTTQPGVLPGLVHRGGMRAQILDEGVIRTGDVVRFDAMVLTALVFDIVL